MIVLGRWDIAPAAGISWRIWTLGWGMTTNGGDDTTQRSLRCSTGVEYGDTVLDLNQFRVGQRRNYTGALGVGLGSPATTGAGSTGVVLPMPMRSDTMSPEKFRECLAVIFGGHGAQTIFARGVGLNFSTVQRYLSGSLPIPQHIVVLVQALYQLRMAGQELPPAFRQRRDDRRRADGG